MYKSIEFQKVTNFLQHCHWYLVIAPSDTLLLSKLVTNGAGPQ
jgi:hypothetical protein